MRNFVGDQPAADWHCSRHAVSPGSHATPAPNDLICFGATASSWSDGERWRCRTRYFIRDSQSAGKRCASGAISSRRAVLGLASELAVCIGLPSDLWAFRDDGYILPPLTIEQHIGRRGLPPRIEQGQLFPGAKQSATGPGPPSAKPMPRCERAPRSYREANGSPGWWCSTDDESKLLQTHSRRGRGQGQPHPEQKEARLRAFSEGNERIIVTKPKIAGMGLNWQHCADMVYRSPTFSSCGTSTRACGGSTASGRPASHPATVVIAETEENVIAAVDRKQHSTARCTRRLKAAMRRQRALDEDWRIALGEPRPLAVPEWLKAA